ncbi:uncharacterized protein MELLADRAFT_114535 [Melampsora larici-populina 98AG31]|uniref:Secreted protein n=1 Tax=Melampsora larici-populina (strain 98AG31 / pathotype 3-4-7) TaxID=747676 RepID=F4SDV1_MELLP|nr:uncharacterized protein MELLADRAFT_114535 [Melampsora larici-populina 98AG31]EGF97177.1 secreted protein [Melampsora larici-populina 98AG31]
MSFKHLIFLLIIQLSFFKFSITSKHKCSNEFTFKKGETKGLCKDSNQIDHRCVRSSCGYEKKRYVPIDGCTLYGTKAPKTNPTQQQCEQYQFPSLYDNQQILCYNGAGVSFLCPGIPGKSPSLVCSTCDD